MLGKSAIGPPKGWDTKELGLRSMEDTGDPGAPIR